MALVKTILATALMQAAKNAEISSNNGEDPIKTQQDYAEAVADAMDTFIKSGTVNVTVATTGTAAAQTGTGTGNIS